jgi:hypothetical protein
MSTLMYRLLTRDQRDRHAFRPDLNEARLEDRTLLIGPTTLLPTYNTNGFSFYFTVWGFGNPFNGGGGGGGGGGGSNASSSSLIGQASGGGSLLSTVGSVLGGSNTSRILSAAATGGPLLAFSTSLGVVVSSTRGGGSSSASNPNGGYSSSFSSGGNFASSYTGTYNGFNNSPDPYATPSITLSSRRRMGTDEGQSPNPNGRPGSSTENNVPPDANAYPVRVVGSSTLTGPTLFRTSTRPPRGPLAPPMAPGTNR